jgi:hypothetical protein
MGPPSAMERLTEWLSSNPYNFIEIGRPTPGGCFSVWLCSHVVADIREDYTLLAHADGRTLDDALHNALDTREERLG